MSSHWRHRTLRICDTGCHEGVPMVTAPATTPGCEPHEPHPRDYVAHSEWADEMMKTHDQRACLGCGLWLIWMPKGFPVA